MASYEWYREIVVKEILSLAASIQGGMILSDKEIRKLLKKNKQDEDTTLTIRINPTKK